MQSRAWFISDTHFGHPSILYFHPERREACDVTLEELSEDKWAAVAKHDEWLIKKWNETIGKRDFVYILGDICLSNREYTEKILRQLHGRKFLIRGNHDKSCNGLENYFEWVGDIKEVKFNHDQYPFIQEGETFACELCHFPMFSWNRRPHGSCHVHGHCHGGIDGINSDSQELRVDVGFDGELAGLEFVPLEKLYEHFRGIVMSHGFSTFQEYIDWKMERDGFRM